MILISSAGKRIEFLAKLDSKGIGVSEENAVVDDGKKNVFEESAFSKYLRNFRNSNEDKNGLEGKKNKQIELKPGIKPGIFKQNLVKLKRILNETIKEGRDKGLDE